MHRTFLFLVCDKNGKVAYMARLKYGEERFSRVKVCGIECEFSDMRIDRGSIPEGKYLYEVAGDD